MQSSDITMPLEAVDSRNLERVLSWLHNVIQDRAEEKQHAERHGDSYRVDYLMAEINVCRRLELAVSVMLGVRRGQDT